MSDGWEESFDCIQRVVAELHGYKRAFNKASVSNWGTRACPCATLNIQASVGAVCTGVAFQFPESQRPAIEVYLSKREGKNFYFNQLYVRKPDGLDVLETVSIYTGKNIVPDEGLEQLAESILKARGSRGSCTEYVIAVFDQLNRLSINDTAVTELYEALHKNSGN